MKKDTYSYQGWLNSDSFLKRTLAITGYSIVGTLLIYVAILVVILLIALISMAF